MGGDTKANGLPRMVEGVVVGYGISLCTCIVAKIAEPTCSVSGMIPVSICWGMGFDIPGPSINVGCIPYFIFWVGGEGGSRERLQAHVLLDFWMRNSNAHRRRGREIAGSL